MAKANRATIIEDLPTPTKAKAREIPKKKARKVFKGIFLASDHNKSEISKEKFYRKYGKHRAFVILDENDRVMGYITYLPNLDDLASRNEKVVPLELELTELNNIHLTDISVDSSRNEIAYEQGKTLEENEETIRKENKQKRKKQKQLIEQFFNPAQQEVLKELFDLKTEDLGVV